MKYEESRNLQAYEKGYIITGVKDKTKIFKTNNLHPMHFLFLYIFLALFLYTLIAIFHEGIGKITMRNAIGFTVWFLIAALLTFIRITNNYYKISFDSNNMIFEGFNHKTQVFDISKSPRIRIIENRWNDSGAYPGASEYIIEIQQENITLQIPFMNFGFKKFTNFIGNFDLKEISETSTEEKLASATTGERVYETLYRGKKFIITGTKDIGRKTVIFGSMFALRLLWLCQVALFIGDFICIKRYLEGDTEITIILTILILFQVFFAICYLFCKRENLYVLTLKENSFKINSHNYNLSDDVVYLYLQVSSSDSYDSRYYYLCCDSSKPTFFPLLKIPENRLECLEVIFNNLEYKEMEINIK